MATKPVTIRQLREMTLALLPDIFGECLMDEDGNFSLSAPFLWDGQVLATNSHIIVMRPASPGLAELLALVPGRKTPDVKPAITGVTFDPTPTRLPDELQGETTCRDCGGTGNYPCGCCDTDLACESCDGRGLALDWLHRVWLAPNVPIGLRYAHMLKRHGAKVFLPCERPDKPIMFSLFDGTSGYVMPMTLHGRVSGRDDDA
jgi:hypothetical protein